MADRIVPKEERALASAAEAFTRYGYARTTMGDIAARAGMSRPALYLLFRDKDAIFDGVVRDLDRRTLAEIGAAVDGMESLEEKLAFACTTWGRHPIELVAAHPDAADLFDLRFAAVRQAYANFEHLLAALIFEHAEHSGIGASPGELAHLLVFSLRGLRDAADDVDAFKGLVELLVAVLVGASCNAVSRSRQSRRRQKSRTLSA